MKVVTYQLHMVDVVVSVIGGLASVWLGVFLGRSL